MEPNSQKTHGFGWVQASERKLLIEVQREVVLFLAFDARCAIAVRISEVVTLEEQARTPGQCPCYVQ